MPAEIQTLPDGEEVLIVHTGNPADGIDLFHLSVIASYSELFGEPDPAKTVVLIRGAMKTKDQEGMWSPVYENLHRALGELVDSGVPPEFMPDVLEAADAPVPGKSRRGGLRDAQRSVRERVAKSGGRQNTSDIAALLDSRKDKLKEGRAAFLGNVAPERDPSPAARKASPLFGGE